MFHKINAHTCRSAVHAALGFIFGPHMHFLLSGGGEGVRTALDFLFGPHMHFLVSGGYELYIGFRSAVFGISFYAAPVFLFLDTFCCTAPNNANLRWPLPTSK